jgi:hypothetical protein
MEYKEHEQKADSEYFQPGVVHPEFSMTLLRSHKINNAGFKQAVLCPTINTGIIDIGLKGIPDGQMVFPYRVKGKINWKFERVNRFNFSGIFINVSNLL